MNLLKFKLDGRIAIAEEVDYLPNVVDFNEAKQKALKGELLSFEDNCVVDLQYVKEDAPLGHESFYQIYQIKIFNAFSYQQYQYIDKNESIDGFIECKYIALKVEEDEDEE